MLRVWLCIAVVGGLVGCGGSEAPKALPKTVPAKGIVTLDAKPLPDATLTFIPRGGTKGIECYGSTNEKGEFSMKQLRGENGAPPGDYTVVVSRYLKPDGKAIALGSSEMPADVGAVESLSPRYSDPTSSTLSALVPAAGGEFKFELKSR
jgi:hypothetical protein